MCKIRMFERSIKNKVLNASSSGWGRRGRRNEDVRYTSRTMSVSIGKGEVAGGKKKKVSNT